MKYNDIPDVETEITKNEYVTVDIKPRRSIKGLAQKIRLNRIAQNKYALIMLPLLALTAVSLGFMIAQLVKLGSLSAVTSILTLVL